MEIDSNSHTRYTPNYTTDGLMRTRAAGEPPAFASVDAGLVARATRPPGWGLEKEISMHPEAPRQLLCNRLADAPLAVQDVGDAALRRAVRQVFLLETSLLH